MTPEQQGLVEDIATRFIAAAPQDVAWTELQVDVSMLNSISGFAATAVDDKEQEIPFFIDDATDKKILHALGRMREDMASAVPGRGAWYIMSLRIPREGKPYVDFDYFTKPTFGVHIGDGAYKQDLKAFPRSENNVPEWLGGKPRPKPEDKPEPKAEPTKAAAPVAAAAAAVVAAEQLSEADAVETTPPVASIAEDTPQVAPPADIQLNAEGVPMNTDQPQDEELLAEESAEIAPLPSPLAGPASAQPEQADLPEQAEPEAPQPVQPPTAPAPEDDTPWYQN